MIKNSSKRHNTKKNSQSKTETRTDYKIEKPEQKEEPISPEVLKPQYNPGEPTFDANFHGVKFDFNYGARVLVPPGEKLQVKITDLDTNCTVFMDTVEGAIVSSRKKYCVRYRLEVSDGEKSFVHNMDLENKHVLLIFRTRAIGDPLAWIAYAEEFRLRNKCKVFVAFRKHIRYLLKDSYPNLIFLEDDQIPRNCYATYLVGVFLPPLERFHQPVDFRFTGLQKAAANILGLPPEPLKTVIKCSPERPIKEPYVCIAVQATTLCKTWVNPSGWRDVIEYLKGQGYRVLCIDKDRAYGQDNIVNVMPKGCEDFTGDIPLQERANMLAHADFFIGGSSGMAWLAWACGTPVVMIGGFTLPFNEFPNPYRVINYNACTGCWHEVDFKNNDYGWCPRHKGTPRAWECSRLISSRHVIRTINKLREDYKLLDKALPSTEK